MLGPRGQWHEWNFGVLGMEWCGEAGHRVGLNKGEAVSEVVINDRLAYGMKPWCLTKLGGLELIEN